MCTHIHTHTHTHTLTHTHTNLFKKKNAHNGTVWIHMQVSQQEKLKALVLILRYVEVETPSFGGNASVTG